MAPGLEQLADVFAPADVDLLGRRSLLRRVDTKFLVSMARLDELLVPVGPFYSAAIAGTTRLPLYETRYFDTPDLRCLHDHRRGRLPRYKIRLRHYPDRAVSFLEVKARSGRVTHKSRRQVEYGCSTLGTEDHSFIDRHCPIGSAAVRPALETLFRRLTLVSKTSPERVTIDVETKFVSDDTQALGDVAIVEVKQPRFSPRSPIVRALKRIVARATPLSKYVIGCALLTPELRINRYLPAIRAVRRLSA